MNFSAFARAFAQLLDPSLRRWIGYSLGLAVASVIGLVMLTSTLIAQVDLADYSYLNWLVQLFGVLFNVVLAFILFPGVMVLWVGIFADSIAREVEQKYYPEQVPGQDVPMAVGVKSALRFFMLWALFNLVLILPSLLIPIPGLSIVLFYAVNAWLLGREYFETATLRHLSLPEARAMTDRHGRRLTLNGVIIAFLHNVPFLNLFAPVLSLAAMIHVFKELAAQEGRIAAQARPIGPAPAALAAPPLRLPE